jgi:hypothetical protein
MRGSKKIHALPNSQDEFASGDQISRDNAVDIAIYGIASCLNKFNCEKYIFGERIVFGRKEFTDGEYMEKGKGCYEWPSRKIHKLARDPHPDMEERFPVPDENVSWVLCPTEKFVEYRPEFACEADRSEALHSVLEKRRHGAAQNPRFRSTFRKLNINRLSEFNDLAVEVRNSSCGPEGKARNPCGRYRSLVLNAFNRFLDHCFC